MNFNWMTYFIAVLSVSQIVIAVLIVLCVLLCLVAIVVDAIAHRLSGNADWIATYEMYVADQVLPALIVILVATSFVKMFAALVQYHLDVSGGV